MQQYCLHTTVCIPTCNRAYYSAHIQTSKLPCTHTDCVSMPFLCYCWRMPGLCRSTGCTSESSVSMCRCSEPDQNVYMKCQAVPGTTVMVHIDNKSSDSFLTCQKQYVTCNFTPCVCLYIYSVSRLHYQIRHCCIAIQCHKMYEFISFQAA